MMFIKNVIRHYVKYYANYFTITILFNIPYEANTILYFYRWVFPLKIYKSDVKFTIVL